MQWTSVCCCYCCCCRPGTHSSLWYRCAQFAWVFTANAVSRMHIGGVGSCQLLTSSASSSINHTLSIFVWQLPHLPVCVFAGYWGCKCIRAHTTEINGCENVFSFLSLHRWIMQSNANCRNVILWSFSICMKVFYKKKLNNCDGPSKRCMPVDDATLRIESRMNWSILNAVPAALAFEFLIAFCECTHFFSRLSTGYPTFCCWSIIVVVVFFRFRKIFPCFCAAEFYLNGNHCFIFEWLLGTAESEWEYMHFVS